MLELDDPIKQVTNKSLAAFKVQFSRCIIMLNERLLHYYYYYYPQLMFISLLRVLISYLSVYSSHAEALSVGDIKAMQPVLR